MHPPAALGLKDQTVKLIQEDPSRTVGIVKSWLSERGVKIPMISDKLTGPQKAALFLFSIGEELASTIVKRLDEEEIKKLGGSMSKISSVSPKDVRDHFCTV